jgi:hypothetical protein
MPALRKCAGQPAGAHPVPGLVCLQCLRLRVAAGLVMEKQLTTGAASPILEPSWEGKVENVDRREGLICICAECKKVIRFLGTVTDEAQALISHGICPECAEKLYGELVSAVPRSSAAGAG